MLRITVQPAEHDRVVLRLEGRLIGPWVRELERVWLEQAKQAGGDKIVVDLSDLTAIDDAGRYLLTVLQRDGARFIATTPLMRSLIEEIERGTAHTNEQ
jgi:anti-anti-sigma regulatory factor